jgi:hypothetical protein
VTEKEWLRWNFTQSMVRYVSGSSPRKLRLFACHCCRRVWAGLSNANRAAVETAENFADGLASPVELEAVQLLLGESGEVGGVGWYVSGSKAFQAAQAAIRDASQLAESPTAEVAAHAQLLRDIFGNPFRWETFAREWRTDTAVTLARQMYESREFSAMPILADALQDAGCDNEDILTHCRDANLVHVRGCWVVDRVLGKH